MLNTETDLDQGHLHNQGPVLVILEAQDTTMVITFIMMLPGEGSDHAHLLPSLAQDWNTDRPLLKPSLFLFYIKPNR